VTGAFGVVKAGYRASPGWLNNIPHPLIIALSVPATLLARRRGGADPLLLLAFIFVLRCALDPWDTVYYPLPFIFALLAWESLSLRRPPVLSLAASLLVWLIFIEAPGHLSPDLLALAFAALALPTLIALATAIYRPSWPAADVVKQPPKARSSAPSAAPISTV
jgi:hypothetical protein